MLFIIFVPKFKEPQVEVKWQLIVTKKLSCRREAAMLRVIENLLGHSRSFKVIQNYTLEWGVCKLLLALHWRVGSFVSFMR